MSHNNFSQFGANTHNSPTCTTESGSCHGVIPPATASGGFMLFGVRVTEGSIRKSVSLNDLSLYEQPQEPNPDLTSGYASDDVVHNSIRNRERKRGVPWTEEEHRLFLLGLKKYMVDEESVQQEPTPQSPQEMSCNLGFSMSTNPVPISPVLFSENQMEQSDFIAIPANIVRPIPVIPTPQASRMVDLDLNQKCTMDPSALSLQLSNSFEKQTSSRHSAFQAMLSLSTGNNVDCSGGNMISVA
ncbi:hypothetical protein IFM89_012987 [Coptis chinensis]|uniref:Uncharacterized protein n=1 Tax=Coptis chinensis TaxID=261450 RepID=A0A835IVY4_9MAGN|nr:hypothetical protein IFM89_012987 [Coptis chinensis]